MIGNALMMTTVLTPRATAIFQRVQASAIVATNKELAVIFVRVIGNVDLAIFAINQVQILMELVRIQTLWNVTAIQTAQLSLSNK